MKNVTFSEKKDIERILASGEVTQDNVVHVISSMAKYNLNIHGMTDAENYSCITRWLKTHYKYYIETELHSTIQQKVNAAHTYSLLESDDLVIYQSELDRIISSNNIRKEKVLFVLLCVAKLQKNIFGYHNGKYKFALTNIFKLARVHIPSTDRNMFMHELLQDGYINAPFKVDEEQRYVTFMSDEDNDIEVLHVSENDFDELAYVYENWKADGVGFARCELCNKLMQQSKTKPRKYCKNCAKLVEKENSKERVRRFREKCNENLTIQN
jgi:hypothetical protein